MKRCTKCGVEKPDNSFSRGKDYCKGCKSAEVAEKARQRARAWYAANKERASVREKERRERDGDALRTYQREYARKNRDKERARTKRWLEDPANRERKRQLDKEWRERNKERKAANDKRWAKENRDKCNEAVKRYYERNPEIRRVRSHLNGARRRGTPKPDLDTRDYILILEGDPCCYCGEPMTDIDHIEPLARGGDGEWDNLTPACRSCNASKHLKELLPFLLERANEGVEPSLALAA